MGGGRGCDSRGTPRSSVQRARSFAEYGSVENIDGSLILEDGTLLVELERWVLENVSLHSQRRSDYRSGR